jgi:hypothetical protein
MMRTWLFLISTVLLLSLAACDVEPQRRQSERPGSRFGYRGPAGDYGTQYREMPAPSPTPPDSGYSTSREPTRTESKPKATPEPQMKKDYPYGSPVPGKPGFVTSPHAPYSGYVDVRGFPPGTEVKDPYTGKIFLVP